MGGFDYHVIPNNTNRSWWLDRGLRVNVLHCMGCCLAPFYLGCESLLNDQSLLTGLQAVPSWNDYFHSPTGNRLGLITASLFMPSLIFCFVGGFVANVWGRRPCIFTGNALLVIGAILNALAQNEGQFIGGRVILGAGGAMIKVAAPALNQEIAHPRLRPVLGALYYSCYYTGSILSSWLCVAALFIHGNRGWRFTAMFQIVGPIISSTILFFAPESPRYHVKKGNADLAHTILSKYHANGFSGDELVNFEMTEIKLALAAETAGTRASYRDFFRTRGNLKRLLACVTLGLGANWVGNGLVSYYLAPVLRSVGVYSSLNITCINAGLAMWNLVVAVIGSLCSERFGRRPMFFTSMTIMFVCYSIVMALSGVFAQQGRQAAGLAVIPFLYLFYGGYSLAWTPLPYLYVTEIMPYSLRTKGLAIYTIFNQLGNAFNQFVNPVALSQLTWKYYAVYLGALLIISLLIFFFFPETKNLSLEAITYVFDHDIKHARSKAVAELHGAGGDETEMTKEDSWDKQSQGHPYGSERA